ncbi:MAG TPA: GNAT family protein [Saprospiraceae bacterium]|mgnify:CR=1 FL=1|nr:GNAT family protein [Saprospiraceae bacterium]HPI09366.1 GNAT family protein [Saprospiraceae bacterium]
MKNHWINEPVTLRGQTVDLIPLEPAHFAELSVLATDKRIWEFYVYDASVPEKFTSIFESAFTEKQNGSQFPFAILHKAENRLIGSTRLLDIQPNHKKLEIGSTWLHPDYWASAVNLECKLLLLTYCFEQLQTVRVQLKTDERNLRSRKAIEKIGGQFEGILRNDMIRDDGTYRNSAYYSLIIQEWPDKKRNLEALFQAKLQATETR